MKKKTAFPLFQEDDYLYLDIEKLEALEMATTDQNGKRMAIAEIATALQTGTFGVTHLIKTLPVALSDCRKIDNIRAEMQKSIEKGSSIMGMCLLLLAAIGDSGIFGDLGKSDEAKQRDKLAQEVQEA